MPWTFLGLKSHGIGLTFGLAVLMGLCAALLALLSGVVGIIFTERTGTRSVVFYAAGGVLAGIISYCLYALILVMSAGTTKGFGPPAPVALHIVLVFGGPGIVGGLVYWLIAGRRAGR
jgi:hypothetical protein